MSERPFMQLYVSDFIGDTLHLSTEQIGAYMLMLMAMWNAGGKLSADDTKLARVCRMSVKKWKSISADLLAFFHEENGSIQHNRLTKELQKSESKSQSRASAGAQGGKAKSLKDKDVRLANATDLSWHLPDTIQIEPSSVPSDGLSPAKKKRPFRMPDDYTPDIEFAVSEGLSLSEAKAEAENIRDWSKSSPSGAKLDWDATWRGWVRRAVKDRPRQRQQAPPRQTAFQQRHQTAIDAFDRKLGIQRNDEFTSDTIELESSDWRTH